MHMTFLQMQADTLASLAPGGNIRWFRPTPQFFTVLKSFQVGVTFIDAGCGTGELVDEAHAAGVRMLGVDLAQREGQRSHVIQANAWKYAYDESYWPVICRPDHSGWCRATIDRARRRRAHVLYVGLRKNKITDCGYIGHAHRWEGVGVEGECMWLFLPVKESR